MHYTTVPLLLCGCETWSFALRKEHRLWVPKRKKLMRTDKLKRKGGLGKNCLFIMRSFMICNVKYYQE